LTIYTSLARLPGGTDICIERYLHEVRPDISFCLNEASIALEIQLSTLSPADIEGRTR